MVNQLPICFFMSIISLLLLFNFSCFLKHCKNQKKIKENDKTLCQKSEESKNFSQRHLLPTFKAGTLISVYR